MHVLAYYDQPEGEKLVSDHCGITTEDGSAVCIPGECSCSSGANTVQPIILSIPPIHNNESLLNQIVVKFDKAVSVETQLEKNNVEENS